MINSSRSQISGARCFSSNIGADSTGLPHAPASLIAFVLVQASDVIAIEALISHPRPCTECPDGRELFNCEANSLCGGCEAAITERLTRARLAFLWYKSSAMRCSRSSSQRLSIKAPTLCGATELAFFRYALVRLGGTFDLVLEVPAIGRQELRDLIDAARTACAV